MDFCICFIKKLMQEHKTPRTYFTNIYNAYNKSRFEKLTTAYALLSL